MPDIMTPAQVAECRERAERATEGPWEALGDEIVTYAVPRTASHPVQTVAMSGVFIEEADAEFVAHARQDIPALCALLLLVWLLRPRETTEIPWSIRLFEPEPTPEWHPQDGTAVCNWWEVKAL